MPIGRIVIILFLRGKLAAGSAASWSAGTLAPERLR